MKNPAILIFLLVLLCVQCQWYQDLPKVDYGGSNRSENSNHHTQTAGDYPPNSKPGNCYAKCMIPEGGTEWRTVLCPAKVTRRVVHQVQTVLREYGYYEGDGSDRIDDETKDALKAFQKDNGLPMGSLDMETLKKMDISY